MLSIKLWLSRRAERAAAKLRAEAERQADTHAAATRKAVEETLADMRRSAWWRLVDSHGWKGGAPMGNAVPYDEKNTFRRIWTAIGAAPHQTEGGGR